MKTLTLIVLIILPLSFFGQQTKKVTNWLPAILAGEKVTVEIDFPINFDFIEKNKK